MKTIIASLLLLASLAGAQTFETSVNFFTTNYIAAASTNTTQFKTNLFDARFWNKATVILGTRADGSDTTGVLTVDFARTWDYYLTNWVTLTNLSCSVTNNGTNQAISYTRVDLEGLSGMIGARVRYTGTNNCTNGFLYITAKGDTKDRQ